MKLLSIGLDASLAHMFALKSRGGVEESFGVLKLWIAQAVRICNLGIPILEEELGADGVKPRQHVTALQTTPKATGVRLAMSR